MEKHQFGMGGITSCSTDITCCCGQHMVSAFLPLYKPLGVDLLGKIELTSAHCPAAFSDVPPDIPAVSLQQTDRSLQKEQTGFGVEIIWEWPNKHLMNHKCILKILFFSKQIFCLLSLLLNTSLVLKSGGDHGWEELFPQN